MLRTHLTDAKLRELHDLAAQWGKIIPRRTGDEAIDFDLSALESIAQAAAGGSCRRAMCGGWWRRR